MDANHEILFTPFKIGTVEVKNRYVMAPMGAAGLADENGAYTNRGVEYYAERARGGVGLIVTGITLVQNEIEVVNKPTFPCVTAKPLAFTQTARVMVERVHAYDTRIFLQLTMGFGRIATPELMDQTKLVAPSAVPGRWTDNICRPLTHDEIKTYVQKFVESAEIAQYIGFDGIEIHGVHEGYLLDQFTMTVFNQRTDEYGGSLENRYRLPCEIVQAIKAKCGPKFPVSLRYSVKSFIKELRVGGLPGEEFVEKGRDTPEGIQAAALLEKAGYDAFNVDVGCYDSWYWNHPPMYQKKGLYLPYAEMIKKAVTKPVITAGRMDNPDLAADSVRSGKTDMVALGRPLLADPELPMKIRKGWTARVRPCLSCQEGCLGRVEKYDQISCAVNPACGREADYGLSLALKKKRVVVAGGGAAGMETARVCALRGHEVYLFEATGQLGGDMIAGGMADFKEDDHALIRWYEQELARLGVSITLGVKITKESIQKMPPDVLVVATGSEPRIISIGGAKNVYPADDVLLGTADPGQHVLISGGGLIGCEIALWLLEKGKNVTIVELGPHLMAHGAPSCAANTQMLIELLKRYKVGEMVGSSVDRPAEGGFIIRTGQKETFAKADSVVLAVGYQSQRTLYDECYSLVPEVYIFGDACRVQNIMYAIWDAYEGARKI